MMAAIGRQLKQSVKVFHSLMLYRRLPSAKKKKKKTAVKVILSFNEGKMVKAAARRTLIVEAVNPVDTRALVIPSQNEKVFRVFDLVS